MGWCVCVTVFPCSDFPVRGMQIYDGPINVQNCTFRKYTALDGRHTSAFGFRLNNSWQSCPNNNVTGITFDNVPVSLRYQWNDVALRLKENGNNINIRDASFSGNCVIVSDH